MRIRLGARYQHFASHAGCVCHTPLVAQFERRIATSVSRRSVLQGIAATFAAASVGGRALAAVPAARDRPVLLTNCRIFDGLSSKLIEGRAILVSGNKIEKVIPAAEKVANAAAIECGGRVVMPGLIDAHWHSIMCAIPEMVAMTSDVPYIHLVAAQEAERTVLRGFTTVRDVGGPSFALKRAIDENRVSGPRIFPSGAMISQTSGHGDFRLRTDLPRSPQTNLSLAETAGISAIADGVDEVLRRTREQLMLGASQIKIMAGGGVSSHFDPIDSTQFTPAEIRAAVDAASDWGTYVCSHVYTAKGIRRAIENGVKCIEHGQLADEDTVKMIADTGTWWSLQPFLADEDANPKASKEQQEQQKRISEGTLRAYELAKKYKAKIAFGTDILFNAQGAAKQGKQLTKLARWFDPSEVLQMATGRSGELLAMSGDRNPYSGALGILKDGAWADLLVVEGNPLQDISLIADPDKNFKLIMKNGRIHKDAIGAA